MQSEKMLCMAEIQEEITLWFLTAVGYFIINLVIIKISIWLAGEKFSPKSK